MNGSRLLTRRAMLVTAAAAVPVSALCWQSLTSSTQGQAPGGASRGVPGRLPTDTYNPIIRVNITPRLLEHVAIQIDGPFRILVPGSPRVLAQSDGVGRSEVRAYDSGIRFADRNLPISQIEIVPLNPTSIWVGRTLYRGSVRVFRAENQMLRVVNLLPLEDYLASVVNSEMPASFPDAARQAQAIVARTYALSVMKGHPQFDLFSTTRSQQYLGYQYLDDNDNSRRLAGESAESRRIANETAGIVCTWQGQVFTTWYTAVCGGRTTNGRSVYTDAVPALTSVACDWCKDADRYRWTSAIARDEATTAIREYLAASGSRLSGLDSIQPAAGVSPGDLPFYIVSDGQHSYRIAGTTLRTTLPQGLLSSPTFTATVSQDRVDFSGQGFGHGVGLCQWGARGLALAGRNAIEILKYYYSGIGTVRLKAS